MPGGAIIAAANGALASLVRALALELAPLRVNAVSPGWVDTPVWENIAGDRKATLHAQMAERLPVRQIGTVADLAHAILFLTQNPFTTGAVLSVDGGHRFV
jgi:NAD(P)-dependent dehydrogenase (short-subunit alcohol dehydrogenase family)